MTSDSYELNVFVNWPFDDAYRQLFEAIVFAITTAVRSPDVRLEADDGSQVRIDKIAIIIGACRLGIHDISRTEPDASTGLPRFNMPLELGMFLGAKRYGRARQKQKVCLILDVARHRYQKFISDIARRYELLRNELPAMCETLHLRPDELTFNDYVLQVEEWLKLNARVAN